MKHARKTPSDERHDNHTNRLHVVNSLMIVHINCQLQWINGAKWQAGRPAVYI